MHQVRTVVQGTVRLSGGRDCGLVATPVFVLLCDCQGTVLRVLHWFDLVHVRCRLNGDPLRVELTFKGAVLDISFRSGGCRQTAARAHAAFLSLVRMQPRVAWSVCGQAQVRVQWRTNARPVEWRDGLLVLSDRTLELRAKRDAPVQLWAAEYTRASPWGAVTRCVTLQPRDGRLDRVVFKFRDAGQWYLRLRKENRQSDRLLLRYLQLTLRNREEPLGVEVRTDQATLEETLDECRPPTPPAVHPKLRVLTRVPVKWRTRAPSPEWKSGTLVLSETALELRAKQRTGVLRWSEYTRSATWESVVRCVVLPPRGQQQGRVLLKFRGGCAAAASRDAPEQEEQWYLLLRKGDGSDPQRLLRCLHSSLPAGVAAESRADVEALEAALDTMEGAAVGVRVSGADAGDAAGVYFDRGDWWGQQGGPHRIERRNDVWAICKADEGTALLEARCPADGELGGGWLKRVPGSDGDWEPASIGVVVVPEESPEAGLGVQPPKWEVHTAKSGSEQYYYYPPLDVSQWQASSAPFACAPSSRGSPGSFRRSVRT
eukprot:TRINITY_DN39354_c0_g1_i1.p1 TRINITY_DN39354_c0_g1~~TRINITY_DN39354_c0_g1_i1.p1  ORF type:complete len:544 (+),score=130.71 TRINITY_DN39354_c0_g1_i1:52-1683(+)